MKYGLRMLNKFIKKDKLKGERDYLRLKDLIKRRKTGVVILSIVSLSILLLLSYFILFISHTLIDVFLIFIGICVFFIIFGLYAQIFIWRDFEIELDYWFKQQPKSIEIEKIMKEKERE